MANRYLISAAGTNLSSYWSTTSGGAGGASVPTVADNVFIDAGTPAGAKVQGAALVCKNFDYSAYTAGGGILTLNNAITFAGHWKGNGTQLGGGGYFFTANATDTNGGAGYDFDLGAGGLFPGGTANTLLFNGAGGRWELRTALIGAALTVQRQAGTFNTNNYALTVNSLVSTGNVARGGSAGTSYITVTNTNTAAQNGGSNDTWDCSNATFNLRATANVPQYNGIVFKDYVVDSANHVHLGAIPGPCNKVERISSGTNQTDGLVISGDVVCNLFKAVGPANPNLITIRSSADLTPRTITAAAVEVDNVHFRNIIGAGAGTWASSGTGSGTNLISDQCGNSGITFTPKQALTRDAAAGYWGTLARWVKQSGPGATRIPIAQDDVNIGAGCGNITATNVTVLGGNIDLRGYTGLFSRTSSSTPYMIFGDWRQDATIDWGVAAVNTCYMEYRGRGACKIYTGGAFGGTVIMPGSSNMNQWVIGDYEFADDFKLVRPAANVGTLSLLAGTLDLGVGRTHSIGALSVAGNLTKTLEGRDAVVRLLGDTGLTLIQIVGSGGTMNIGQTVFDIVNPSGAVRTIYCIAGVTFGTLKYALPDSPGPLSFTGVAVANNLDIADGTAVTIQAGAPLTILSKLRDNLGSTFGYQQMATQDASNLLTVADASVLRVNGDITIDAKIQLPSWSSPGVVALVSKITGTTTGYVLRTTSGGGLTLFAAGGQASSSVSCSTVFADGDTGWVRVSRRQSDGRVQFFTSSDGINWTQLGTDQSLAPGVAVGQSTEPLYLGSRTTNNDVMTKGRFHRARVYSDITATTKVGGWNFETKPTGQNTVADESGNGNVLNIPTNLRAGDGRVEFRSVTGGSTAYLDLCDEPPKCQQTFTQDITCTSPDKLYVQGDSGASANVKVGTFPAGAPYIRQWEQAGATTVAFKKPAKPGNKLIAAVTSSGSVPNWVTPSGWTQVDVSTGPSLGGVRVYEKIADGTETDFTTTTTGGAVAVFYAELANVGVPTYQIGKNSGSALTSIALASPAMNATKASYAIGFMSANSSFGAATGGYPTDGFGEIRSQTTPVNQRFIGKLVTAPGTVNPSYGWTSSRTIASLLMLAEQNISNKKHHAFLASTPSWV